MRFLFIDKFLKIRSFINFHIFKWNTLMYQRVLNNYYLVQEIKITTGSGFLIFEALARFWSFKCVYTALREDGLADCMHQYYSKNKFWITTARISEFPPLFFLSILKKSILSERNSDAEVRGFLKWVKGGNSIQLPTCQWWLRR